MEKNTEKRRCFLAGIESNDLYSSMQEAEMRAEWRDRKTMAFSVGMIAKHAGTLTTLMKGPGREAAMDLAKRAKEIRTEIEKMKPYFGKKEREKIEDKLVALRDSHGYWVTRMAEAQCDGPKIIGKPEILKRKKK